MPGERKRMPNPWRDLPLQDYEGHVSFASVGQAQMLARTLGLLVEQHAPRSAAIIGCAGGNGMDRIGPGQLERLVAVDINHAYVEAVGLFEPVDLIYAALAPIR